MAKSLLPHSCLHFVEAQEFKNVEAGNFIDVFSVVSSSNIVVSAMKMI